MGGFSSVNGDPLGTIMNADNVSFDGTARGTPVTTDGELLIGSTTTPHIRVGHLTSNDGSIIVTEGPGTLDLSGMGASGSTTVSLSDDFMDLAHVTDTYGLSSGQVMSQMPWVYSAEGSLTGSVWGANTPTAQHPGVWTQSSISISSKNGYLFLGPVMNLGGGAVTINWIFNIVNLSNATNTYTLYIGLADGPTLQLDGVYFSYTDGTNSGDWQLIGIASSSATTVNTTTAVTTGWHNAKIVINAAGTSAQFFMDGVSLGTVSSNISTAAIGPIISCARSAGTIATGSLLVDAFYMTQTLTTPR